MEDPPGTYRIASVSHRHPGPGRSASRAKASSRDPTATTSSASIVDGCRPSPFEELQDEIRTVILEPEVPGHTREEYLKKLRSETPVDTFRMDVRKPPAIGRPFLIAPEPPSASNASDP